MDVGRAIIITSLIFQIGVALLALRLITISGRSGVWVLMALASSLMAYRRWVALRNTFPPLSRPVDMEGEIVALIISMLMVLVMIGVYKLLEHFRQTEKRLINSEGQFRAIYEESPVGIALTDLNGASIQANPAFQKMLGYSAAELEALTLDQITYPPDLNVLRWAGETVRQDHDSIFDAEKRYVRKDGTPLWVRVSGRSIADQNYQPGKVMRIIQNIAERKTAEEALRESEARLRAIMMAAADGILLTDEAGRISMWNPGMERITGLLPVDVLGKPLRDLHAGFVPPEKDDPDMGRRLDAEMHQILTQGLPDFMHDMREQTVARPDGSRRIVQEQLFAIPGQDGRFLLGAIVHDVTEQRLSDQALLASETRYRQIVNTAHEGVWVIDRDSNTSFVNQTLCDMLGYTMQEMIGRHLFSFMDEDAQKEAQKNLAERAQGINAQHDFRFRRKDGTPLWTIVSTNALMDDEGNYLGALAMITDISERKQMELALRRSEANLFSIFNSLSAALFLLDSSQRIIAFNRAAADWVVMMSGHDLEAGTTVEEHLPQGVVTQFEEHFAASLAGQFVTVESGVGLYGDQRRIEFRYVPVITPQGDTLGVCLMIEDVSARHESIRQAAELTLEKERLRILSEFVTGVSHEFRTPLSIINSSVYLLRRSTDAQRQQNRLDQIEQQSGAILSLVDAMVTMVDLERITLVRVPLDLPQLAESACTTAAGRYSSKSIGIELQIQNPLPLVYGDPVRLMTALTNILDNALRFNHDGGRIWVNVGSRDDEEVTISVRDTGSGIAVQDLLHLFELFYRSDTAHTTRGLGLGLPIANKIVTNHGGRIEVESELGAGSTFRVILPTQKST